MHPDANLLCQVALYAWVPVALWIASRWNYAKATAWLLLLPAMFLPEIVFVKPPGLPAFEKQRIAVVWALIAVLVFHRGRLSKVRLGTPLSILCFVVVAGRVMTVLTNSDSISSANRYVPAHVPYDVVHAVLQSGLDIVAPFVLGAAMFNGRRELRILLRSLVVAGLIYSLLQLVELRLSPQLHIWVYGFFQHSFDQVHRGGGYRPTVFMENGLEVAMFTLVAVTAAAVLFKCKIRAFRPLPPGFVLGYLWLLQLLLNSVAAFLYSLLTVPLVVLTAPKTQVRVAAVIAAVVLAYPVARGADLVPVESILEWVGDQYGEEKVESVWTRFVNERALLDHANERGWFGWGWYGRGYVYDSSSGKNLSVRDGDWIITLGDFGRIGFYSKYLLILLPIFSLLRRFRSIPSDRDRRLLSGLALIIAVSAFDLLPNGNFNNLVFMYAGALATSPLAIAQSAVRQRANADQARRKRRSGIPRPATAR